MTTLVRLVVADHR